MDISSVISKNLKAWMESSLCLDTNEKLAAAAKVGYGTVRRTRLGDGNVTVQNLELIARAFDRRAIDLLTDGCAVYRVDPPARLHSAEEPPVEERELLTGFREASPDVRELMLDAARRAIARRDLHKRSDSQ